MEIIRKTKSNIFICLLVMIFTFIPVPVKAASGSTSELNSNLPDISILTNESGFTKSMNDGYFDFNFTPGEDVNLGVSIKNTSDKQITVKMTPGTVITNQGHIVYGDQSNQMIDKSNAYPFSKMVKDQKITIEPNASKIVKIPVNVPKVKFNGTILGNLAFTVLGQNKTNNNSQKNIATINNVVRQALVVRMRQGDQPEPNFEIGDPATGGTSTGPAFTVPIRNTAANYFNESAKTTVSYLVTKKGLSNTSYKAKDTNISMAPNSFYYGTVSTDSKAIEPGNYNMQVLINYKGRSIKFSKDFKVTKVQTDKLNNQYPGQLKKPQSNLNLIIIIVIAVVILVLLVALLLGIYKGRKRMAVINNRSNKIRRRRTSKSKK